MAVRCRHAGLLPSALPGGLAVRSVADYRQLTRPGRPARARIDSSGIRCEDRKTQGRYDEARELYEHCIALLNRTVGSAHPSVAVCRRNLALLAEAAGSAQE